MRLSENLTTAGVASQAVFAMALIATALIASLHVFGGDVLRHSWARLVVIVGLVGAVYLGSSRDFYMPFLGPGVVPTSVLKVGSPAAASVAITIDVPEGAVHVMYWAAKQAVLPFESPKLAYDGFSNAGVVPVAGGRATLRMACPGTYKTPMGRVTSRHVHFRYVYASGAMSSVKTLPVSCP
jgi:hypothetical protein